MLQSAYVWGLNYKPYHSGEWLTLIIKDSLKQREGDSTNLTSSPGTPPAVKQLIHIIFRNRTPKSGSSTPNALNFDPDTLSTLKRFLVLFGFVPQHRPVLVPRQVTFWGAAQRVFLQGSQLSKFFSTTSSQTTTITAQYFSSGSFE